MFSQIEALASEIAQFVEMDAEHFLETEGCVFVADTPVLYTKHDDVVELECDGVIWEVDRFEFRLV